MIPSVERAMRRAERERNARRAAEALLERKSLELYHTNEKLRSQAQELENLVRIRTADLEKALESAESATSAKSDFLAVMSHEIRTPLNGIIGIAEILSQSSLVDDQSTQLNLLIESGNTLMALINDILDFSKIESGQLELEEREFDPSAELQSTAATYRASALAKGLELKLELKELPAMVLGDSHRLRQVVSNLLSNAIKFTSDGEVSMRATGVEINKDKWRLDIEVKDTGIGIPEDSVKNLFKKFSQADSSTTRKFGGSGLGLAICKRLIEAMGGAITLESAPVGSVFRFHVTFQAVASPQTARPIDLPPAEIPDLCRLSILLVTCPRKRDTSKLEICVLFRCLVSLPRRCASTRLFPPNACRGERRGVWGRAAPI